MYLVTITYHDTDACTKADCFRCKLQSINMAGAAMITRQPNSAGTHAWEERTIKDMDAYKRLRRDGLQPKGVVGSAKAEAFGQTRFEVETGVRLHPKLANKVEDLQGHLKNGGMVPLASSDA